MNSQRVTNQESVGYIETLTPFNNSRKYGNIWARNFVDSKGDHVYDVYSYGARIVTVTNGEISYLDLRQYSRTTSKHQSLIRSALANRPVANGAEILERKGRR
jgi:hypothetical protein